jgi:type I restriction enzyme M protein
VTVRLTQQQLESYLWGAATLLRGVIDAGDYKQFIFPLMFLKRLSDVYDEESARALAESSGDVDFAAFPENHRFQIPNGEHWKDLRAVGTSVGSAIQKAMREIETANQDQLFGIFGDAQWTNKERLPDATLKDLVEHFSTQTLSLTNVPEDEFGQAYEYLIKKFADDSGHTAAEFYTNRTLVHLMTLMLDPQPGESIYDPTCGTGGMLLSAVVELRRRGQEWRTLKLYGQERNLMTSAIARMNLFLHGIEDFEIVRDDTLARPRLMEGDRLRRFDVVLANPPYSIKQWDRKAWESDPYGRNTFGVPPQGRADYAFWQHILASLKPASGRCAILFPHGVLFRDEEQAMRKKIVEADLIECVLGLGPNLFYNSPMEACVVVCRAKKPAERREKILLINALKEVTRERAQSFLEERHIENIVSAYQGFADIDGFAVVATNEEIAANNYNLSIPLYVRGAADEPVDSAAALADALDAWEASSAEVREAMDGLFETLEEAGLGR